MKICCVFSLESPHGGDSNEYKQNTIFNIKKKITLNYPKPAAVGFFLGTQERVRNSHGKRAIIVGATDVLWSFLSGGIVGVNFVALSGIALFSDKVQPDETLPICKIFLSVV